MLEKDQVVGRTIRRIVQAAGAPKAEARYFLELEEGRLLELLARDVRAVDPAGLETVPVDLAAFDERRFLPGAVREVAVNGEGEVMVALANGTYLEVFETPWGTFLRGDDFKGWDDEEKSEPYVRFWERDPVKPWEAARKA